MREKSLVVENPKVYQCRAEDEASFQEWINRIESISGKKDSYYLGKPATPNASPLRLNLDAQSRSSTPRPVKRSNSWHGQEETHRQKLKSYDYDFRIGVIKKIGKTNWKGLTFKERLEIMEEQVKLAESENVAAGPKVESDNTKNRSKTEQKSE